jgi:lysozyme
MSTQLRDFLGLIEGRYGVKPILYSGLSFAAAQLQGFGDYPLWLAEYTSAPMPRIPGGWKTWTFWQYSQDGRIDGVDGAVDLDRFNGDLNALKALLVD